MISPRQRLLRLAVAFSLLISAIAVFAFALATHRHRGDRATLEQVKVGMSREEVMSILGGPPGDYGTGLQLLICKMDYFGGPCDRWVYDGLALVVAFDQDDKVADAVVIKGPRLREPNWINRIRAKLRL